MTDQQLLDATRLKERISILKGEIQILLKYSETIKKESIEDVLVRFRNSENIKLQIPKSVLQKELNETLYVKKNQLKALELKFSQI